jgi:hypothetical protein
MGKPYEVAAQLALLCMCAITYRAKGTDLNCAPPVTDKPLQQLLDKWMEASLPTLTTPTGQAAASSVLAVPLIFQLVWLRMSDEFHILMEMEKGKKESTYIYIISNGLPMRDNIGTQGMDFSKLLFVLT